MKLTRRELVGGCVGALGTTLTRRPLARAVTPSQWAVEIPAGETFEIHGLLETNVNVVVHGTLRMRPGSTLRFVQVDETRFQGGGNTPLDTDIGLWVRGSGRLDIQGSDVLGWNREGTHPTWMESDELLLAPNEADDAGWNDREKQSTFTAHQLGTPVPTVRLPNGELLPTEVLNMTRDVVIEGTPGGRAHIHINSDQPQSIRNCAIRHMGPRRTSTESPRDTEGVPGRYPLHFHVCGDGSRGSTIDNVVVRDSGNHAFVPHSSHGIHFKNCIAYNVFEEPYWWDLVNPSIEDGFRNRDEFTVTRDVFYDRCVAALVFGGFHMSGFSLSRTEGGRIEGCVTVACQGNSQGSGFHWPGKAAPDPNIWLFRNNVTHNNKKGGTRVWQNTPSTPHDVDEFTIYNCGAFGIFHGAYGSPGYHYSRFQITGVETAIIIHAVSSKDKLPFPDRDDGYALSWEMGRIASVDTGVRLTTHIAESARPLLIKEVHFQDVANAVVVVDEGGGKETGPIDLVYCTRDGRGLLPADVSIESALRDFRLRVQNQSGDAWQMDHVGRTRQIAPFYPLSGGG